MTKAKTTRKTRTRPTRSRGSRVERTLPKIRESQRPSQQAEAIMDASWRLRALAAVVRRLDAADIALITDLARLIPPKFERDDTDAPKGGA